MTPPSDPFQMYFGPHLVHCPPHPDRPLTIHDAWVRIDDLEEIIQALHRDLLTCRADLAEAEGALVDLFNAPLAHPWPRDRFGPMTNPDIVPLAIQSFSPSDVAGPGEAPQTQFSVPIDANAATLAEVAKLAYDGYAAAQGQPGVRVPPGGSWVGPVGVPGNWHEVTMGPDGVPVLVFA